MRKTGIVFVMAAMLMVSLPVIAQQPSPTWQRSRNLSLNEAAAGDVLGTQDGKWNKFGSLSGQSQTSTNVTGVTPQTKIYTNVTAITLQTVLLTDTNGVTALCVTGLVVTTQAQTPVTNIAVTTAAQTSLTNVVVSFH